LPDGASGLALEGDALRVLGVDRATAQSYLDRVRAAWAEIVREAAMAELYRRATAAFRAIREELAEAEEAEALGVPPPRGRSSQELQAILDAGRAAFKQVYDAVSAAQSVAGINAALARAREQGLTWLVPESWQAYPEECPWEVAGG